MSYAIKQRADELLREAEVLLRKADNHLETSSKDERVTARKQRNAINAACNALHRATRLATPCIGQRLASGNAGMTCHAEVQRKWMVRGEYPNGNPLAFTVLAFDHAEARCKADAKRGRAGIHSIVLKD